MTNILKKRYRIIRNLSRGGFGETFLAEDMDLPSVRRCVIKQLKPLDNNSQVYELVKERFSKEAEILERLGDKHLQIPTLYAYFEEAGQFFLVQEWIEGTTLTEKVREKGILNENSVKEILLNALAILDYVHAQKIIHRDIKPDNIILRAANGQPVLIDFGAVKETMSTVLNPAAAASVAIGTPPFMPGEQVSGRPLFSSDLYSLGLTAIYLLTGKYPQELENHPLTGEWQWRKYALQVSSSFAEVLDKAVKLHPRDRYHSAQEMRDAIQNSSVASISSETSAPPTVVTPPTPATEVSQTPSRQAVNTSVSTSSNAATGLPDWQKASIIGTIVGVFIMVALLVNNFLGRSQHSQPIATQPTASSSPTPSDSPTSIASPTASSSPAPSDSPTSVVSPTSTTEEVSQTSQPVSTPEGIVKITPTPSPTFTPDTPSQPSPPPTSKTSQLSSEEQKIDDLADRIFYEKYPQLGWQKIRPEQTSLVREWQKIRACEATVDYLFYQRHPELNERKILPGERDLSKEWSTIKKQVSGCK
jgi:serine/threonine protein kinase, bacterial